DHLAGDGLRFIPYTDIASRLNKNRLAMRHLRQPDVVFIFRTLSTRRYVDGDALAAQRPDFNRLYCAKTDGWRTWLRRGVRVDQGLERSRRRVSFAGCVKVLVRRLFIRKLNLH